MPNHPFSPNGFRLYLTALLGMFGYVAWNLFADIGIVGWVDRFQAYYLFSGYYYPELTFLIFILPILIISYAVGLLYDYLTRQGVYTGYENSPDLAKPNPNSTIEYQAATRKEIIDQVRTKYQAQIQQLKLLGFEEFGFYREIVPWFGAPLGLTHFWGTFIMLGNEVVRMGPDWTVNAFFPLMASRKDATYSSIFGMGTKFYTSFLDGTLLVTATYAGFDIHDERQKIYRISVPGSIQSAWAAHQQQIKEFCAEGKTVSDYISMANYFSVGSREDDYLRKNRVKVSKAPGVKSSPAALVTSTAMATIVFFGIFMSFFFAFTFVGNIMSYIYPGCWVVKGLHNDSLLLHFLGIPGCMAIGWFFARLQHKPFIINGMGTRFYEVEPVKNSQGYISTKWLMCLGVPLMPVSSYLVTKEVVQFQETYTFQLLKELNWKQVKETFHKARVRYVIMALIVVLIMGALIVWPIAQCG